MGSPSHCSLMPCGKVTMAFCRWNEGSVSWVWEENWEAVSLVSLLVLNMCWGRGLPRKLAESRDIGVQSRQM